MNQEHKIEDGHDHCSDSFKNDESKPNSFRKKTRKNERILYTRKNQFDGMAAVFYAYNVSLIHATLLIMLVFVV